MVKPPEKVSAGTMAEMLDAFVEFSEGTKAPSTARWYSDYLQDFLNYVKAEGHAPGTLPADLTPIYVPG